MGRGGARDFLNPTLVVTTGEPSRFPYMLIWFRANSPDGHVGHTFW